MVKIRNIIALNQKRKILRNEFYIKEDIINLIVRQDFDKLLKYYLNNKDIQLDIVHYLQKDAEKKYFAGFIKESLNSYKFLENKIKYKKTRKFFKTGLIAFKLRNKMRLAFILINVMNLCFLHLINILLI